MSCWGWLQNWVTYLDLEMIRLIWWSQVTMTAVASFSMIISSVLDIFSNILRNQILQISSNLNLIWTSVECAGKTSPSHRAPTMKLHIQQIPLPLVPILDLLPSTDETVLLCANSTGGGVFTVLWLITFPDEIHILWQKSGNCCNPPCRFQSKIINAESSCFDPCHLRFTKTRTAGSAPALKERPTEG